MERRFSLCPARGDRDRIFDGRKLTALPRVNIGVQWLTCWSSAATDPVHPLHKSDRGQSLQPIATHVTTADSFTDWPQNYRT
ncbi:hypothetical protein RRG08_045997 [Elysia crispata]|uniref:Uncharacterized protein n=1 Tax=Elysia crispata TaxID=231223 RepID=A0AAE1D7N0_9GAST|nr:hypothetical protein RRG08_045997 [Elysia crispata]